LVLLDELQRAHHPCGSAADASSSATPLGFQLQGASGRRPKIPTHLGLALNSLGGLDRPVHILPPLTSSSCRSGLSRHPTWGQPTVSGKGRGLQNGLPPSFRLPSPPKTLEPGTHRRLHFGAATALDPTGFRVSPSPSRRRWGARAPQQADTQAAAATHANPCLRVRAWLTSAHRTVLSPSSGPGHTCASQQAGARSPTDRRPQTGGRSRSRGVGKQSGHRVRAATASGRSRQAGQRPEGESSGGEETAGRPVAAGRVQDPTAPHRPPPPAPVPHRPLIPAPAIHVSESLREAGGLSLTPRQPREGPSAGRTKALGASKSRKSRGSRAPQPRSPIAGSHSTSVPIPARSIPRRPVGAPWGTATRPLSTSRPQTRPKFPRPPSGRAPTCRVPGFSLSLPGAAAASSSAAQTEGSCPVGLEREVATSTEPGASL
jgi:hypothetical protein